MKNFWRLEGADIFSGLERERALFLENAAKLSFQRHQIIFLEGEKGDACYYVTSGLVRIFSVHYSGKEPIFFMRRKGELFGVSEVLEGFPRAANAQAVAPVTAYRLSRDKFESLLSGSWPLARRVISLLGKRVRQLGDTIHNLMALSVEKRLARLLVALAYNNDSFDLEKPAALPMRISQEHLAQLVGATQPTVSEELKKFQQNGLIAVEKRIITLLRPRALLELGESGN